MDAFNILILLIIYSIVFGVFVIILLCPCYGFQSISKRIKSSLEGVSCMFSSALTPSCFGNTWHYLVYTSNPVTQIIYLLLLSVGYYAYMKSVLPHVSETFLGRLPIYLLVANLIFFYLASTTDPGLITQANVSQKIREYKFDDAMYTEGKECTTCQTLKPARSKHCSVCKSAVINENASFFFE